MGYKWPLAIDSFTFLDRLKISAFILNKHNQLTMGKKVEEFENLMTQYTGVKALGVSSGSAANQLIFELYKQRNPEKFKNSLLGKIQGTKRCKTSFTRNAFIVLCYSQQSHYK